MEALMPASSIRRLAAQSAAHESWARTENWPARTAPARAAFEAKFLEQADGDPVRAASLRKAYYMRLALKSAKARAQRRLADVEQRLQSHEGGDAA
ncbi:hypothetical protein QI633_08110 [Nocardioides sp. QY071]|uniref:hypothetical protein n=1 Tax=Nocardioides sp. QY071 TaxID=3044187 RepID=UPI00249A315E|nr:hypothetical protein [Nocardioides sp. QY071]WGY03716.1 hypothetical protein QI633_08110 [Nocardioides sp. QY071]